MEKGPVVFTPLPEVSQPSQNNRKHVLLTSWGSVATALLLTVIIGGAFYTAELKSRQCETALVSNINYKYYHQEITIEKETYIEDVNLEESSQTQLIVKKNKEGAITLITAIDYTKKISATYIPDRDICYLLAGKDMDFAAQWSSAKNVSLTLNDSEVRHDDYEIDTNNAVTDQSLVPSALRPYCHGKPTYWGHPTTQEEMKDAKQKRACRQVASCSAKYDSRRGWYTECSYTIQCD